MAVKVTEKATGAIHNGKYAAIQGANLNLYSGIMSDKKGGWRGCGKRIVFVADAVSVAADDPAKEMKQA